MSDRLSPQRETEIREHLASTENFSPGNLAARDLLAELAAVRKERDEAQKRVAELQADADMLNALYAAGVDNWEGYDDALEAAS